MLLLVSKGDKSFDKHGNIQVNSVEDTANNTEKPLPDEEAPSTAKAGLRYRGFNKKSLKEWWRNLESNKDKAPSEEQYRCIKAIVSRCEQEAREEQRNVEFRSEPLRLILHGVPGVQAALSPLPPPPSPCFYPPIYQGACTWHISRTVENPQPLLRVT